MKASEADRELSAWRALMHAVSACKRSLRRELEPFGVHPGQVRIIRLLGEAGAGGLQLNDLSKGMEVTSACTTRLVDRLEQEGYVERRADPDDRRAIRAVLTPKGQQLLEQVAPVHRAWVERCMSCLSPEEQTQVTALLSRLADHATAMVKDHEVRR